MIESENPAYRILKSLGKILLFFISFMMISFSVFYYANSDEVLYIDILPGTAELYDVSLERNIIGRDTSLNKGFYNISFEMENTLGGNHEVVGNIKIANIYNNGASFFKEIHANTFSSGEKHSFTIQVLIERDNTFIRPYLYLTRGSGLILKSISVQTSTSKHKKLLKTAKATFYEEEDFQTLGGKEVYDMGTSNGKAFLINQKLENHRYSIFGPYSVSEKPGIHIANFRLKTNNSDYKGPLAQIEVFNPGGDGVNKYLILYGDDFVQSGIYQDFPIEYERTTEGSIEFRVHYIGGADLYIDHIKNTGLY